MPACKVRSGFFELRECGGEAAQICPSCSRPVCARHLSAVPASPLFPVPCVECAAEKGLSPARGPRGMDDLDSLADNASFYRFRRAYYRRSSFDPPGVDDLMAFNQEDQAAFDQAAGPADELGGDREVSDGDS